MNLETGTARSTRPTIPGKGLVRAVALGVMLGGCDVAGAPNVTDSGQAHEPRGGRALLSWKLPKPLQEISGLASDSVGLVYAVADERATVFVLNPESGKTVSVFGLGNPVVKGDFEGLTLHDKWLYLITSEGRLLRTAIADGAESERTSLEQMNGSTRFFEDFSVTTGCQEIEGLAADPAAERLWIACKEIAPDTEKKATTWAGDASVIRLEVWSVDLQRLLPEAAIELPLAGVLALTGQKKFKPSGLAFVPATDLGKGFGTQSEREGEVLDLLVISGAQRAYSRWRWPSQTPNGELQSAALSPLGQPRLLSAGRLPAEHRQPEGIAASAQGQLLIADEGGDKRGRLRIYPQGSLP